MKLVQSVPELHQRQHDRRLGHLIGTDHHGQLGSQQRQPVYQPFGGGVGKIVKIGKQAMNTQMQAFYNVEKPDNGPDWTLRLQLQFLFPK